MNLPDHLTARIRGLLDAAETDPAVVRQLAAALADELTAWVASIEGYVPREVLADRLDAMFTVAFPNLTPGSRERTRAVLAGQCPAWFVLADWDRMTSEDRRLCSRFVHEAFLHVGISVWHDDYHTIRDAMWSARAGQLLAVPYAVSAIDPDTLNIALESGGHFVTLPDGGEIIRMPPDPTIIQPPPEEPG